MDIQFTDSVTLMYTGFIKLFFPIKSKWKNKKEPFWYCFPFLKGLVEIQY